MSLLRIAAVLLAFSGLGATAAETPKLKPPPPVWHAGLEPASASARADGALVLLVFSAQWCGPCKMLKAKTLDAPAFAERSGPLHAVRLDIDAHPDTARRFRVHAVPDMLLLTGDGKIVARRSGYADVDTLVAWIVEGRARAAAGVWQGTAPASEAQDLLARAQKGTLTDDDWETLRERLGSADPATRRAAVGAMLALRDRAMPLLISATNDPYLGVRIGATEAVAHLAPTAPHVDAWAETADRTRAAQALAAWWKQAGKLPPPPDAAAVAPAVARAIDGAIQALQGDDAVARTDAMTELVGLGSPALPKIREAIRRCERRGDRRALWALEDVRWAILVPDTVARAAPGARRALARGTSQERHDAAVRLAASNAALPALRELVADGDPLVQEGAAQALAKIGGPDALDAMGALLRSTDSNVRMTAAQCLGQTKNPAAAKQLVTVLQDPDEVVVCTALAALEEIKASEQGPALIRCLADTRWRVRAAAAETIGKLKVAAGDPVRKLIADPDPFVVKSALEALGKLDQAPGGPQLKALAKRLPALAGYAVAQMLKSNSPDTLKGVEELYDTASDKVKADILAAAAGTSRGYGRKDDLHWKPLLTRGMQSPNATLRRHAATALLNRSTELASQVTGPLLDDADRDVQIAAATVVCRIAAHRWGVDLGREDVEQGILIPRPPADGGASLIRSTLRRGSAPHEGSPEAYRKKCFEQHAAWHKALRRRAGTPPHSIVALALFATGDGKSDIPLLAKAMAEKTFLKDIAPVGTDAALPLILIRLPWPEGTPVAEAVCSQPALHAAVCKHQSHAAGALGATLLDPARIAASLANADGAALQTFAGQLLDGRDGSGMSLLTPASKMRAMLEPMLASKRPVLRAMAVFAYGFHRDEAGLAVCRKALAEKDPWIRRAAVLGLGQAPMTLEEREELLGPSLRDPDDVVVRAAAIALLTPELRRTAGLQYEFRRFSYVKALQIYGSISWSSDGRAPAVIARRPTFLTDLRKLSARGGAPDKNGKDMAPILALLLAQYGDFAAFHAYARTALKSNTLLPPTVAGIALSRDPQYLPPLEAWFGKSRDNSAPRALLKSIRGTEGDAARKLRREANRRLRQQANF